MIGDSVVETYLHKMVQGDTVTLAALELSNPDWIYGIHTVHILGEYTVVATLNINGITGIQLSGSSILNYMPITEITLTTSAKGVLLIGRRQKRKIFG